MPEQPPSNKRPPLVAAPLPRAPAARYAELHCKTNFSFLEGASHPDELVLRAAELGYAALAITDRHSLAGVVRAHGAAKQVGLKLLIGAEIWPADGPPLVLLATDRASYGRLARLITCGCRRTVKGDCQLTFADLAEHGEGLLAGVLLAQSSRHTPCAVTDPRERHTPRVTVDQGERHTECACYDYRELFGDRCFALAELHCGPNDERLLEQWLELARRTRIPLVAAGDVHYHRRGRLPLADVLTAVRLGCTVAEAGDALFPNAERFLKPPDEMAIRFARAPGAIERSVELAARATFSLDELRYEYPEELAPPGESPLEYLTRLAAAGAANRYPRGIPTKVRQLIEHELRLIGELHYEAYFLTVHDLVLFARGRNILCQGRGSAANSAVCFCLGVTSVDPERMDVLFERFVSREREEAPDIDVDFEHERREEVLQYVYEKYGRERAGIAAEVITYRTRSAIRDVGKALGLSLDRVDALAKNVEGHHAVRLADRCRDVGLDPDSFVGRRLVALVDELIGFPRHLGQHVGGMVITQGPLAELVPIENAAMPDRTVIQWNKDDLDELGILKVDCLSLGMLTAIRRCFALIEKSSRHTPCAVRRSGLDVVTAANPGLPARAIDSSSFSSSLTPHPSRLTLADIPPDDPAVYDMICRADTMGVFQIESRAQMSMLPRLQPRTFYDLVIEVAIVRPGPIQGDMVHPYLRRRAHEEPVNYPNDAIREVLHKTLGVPLFQEQAMRLAVVAAGFTPGEADQLRRAMGAWRRPGVIEQFRQKLIDGMLARGLSAEFAAQVFHQIRGFGEYGFPESHAASFALLVYVSAWLKCHYPAQFAAALINSQPMGFYAPAQLVRDARQHGVEVRGVDVNASQWDCTLEHDAPQNAPALRLGLRMINGFREADARRIEAARKLGSFGASSSSLQPIASSLTSLTEFARRTGLSRAVIARLAEADAFGSLQLGRREATWQSLSLDRQVGQTPLFDRLADDEPAAELPRLTEPEQVLADYQTAGLSLRAHPLQFHRDQLDQLRIEPAVKLGQLPDGCYVRVAGLVLVRQRPATARGITFVTLEDETGVANLIIRPDVWERFRRPARTAAALIASGRLQRQENVIHVLVARLHDLTERLRGLKSQSRDFQ